MVFKKLVLTFFVAVLLISVVSAAKGGKNADCTTIKSGELLASDGSVIETGYDQWGYNYQAHMFNGFYCDAYRNAGWCQAYRDDSLMMKWNDAWLSNKDCDGDGTLDRHRGFDSYIASGAWLTNHISGEYELDEEVCKWNYFVKIVAKPTADYDCDSIWGSFCVIQTVSNDPCAEEHGLQSKADRPGLGNW